MGLGIEGKPVEEVVADPEATDEVLAGLFGPGFGGDEGREKLKGLLARLDANQSLGDETALRGICGLSTSEFLRALVDTSEERVTTGLIGDYLFEFDNNLKNDGFSYEGRWPGHLTVDTITEVFRKSGGRKTLLADRTVYLQWHIGVVQDDKHDGFEVRLRQGDRNNPNDPYPGTVPFPPEALALTGDRSIWERDLDHKLWAQGTEIVVERIYRRIGDGEVELLPETHEFYKPCEEACVDMMTRGFPPTFRIEFPEQSGYCLGRCQQPYIVNSM